MRLCGNASGFPTGLYEQEGSLCLFLAADFCAEHEFGIRQIHEDFGIKDDKTLDPRGFIAYRATLTPAILYEEKNGFAALVFHSYLFEGKSALNYIRNLGIKTTPEKPVAGAWNTQGFAAAVRGEDNIVRLRAIRDAIAEARVCIFLAAPSQNPFQRLGLSVVAVPPSSEEDHD